jgi:Arc/MetJ-type ribon-helix-helix transcriptional regulator
MVTDTDTTPLPAREPVRVTLDLPPQVVADYERLAADGVYLSRDEGLRSALVASWRFERGTYMRLRLDLLGLDHEDDGADEAVDAVKDDLGGEPSDADLGPSPETDSAG